VRVADLVSFGYVSERTGLYRVHASNITAQVDRTRRAEYLAICRENAVKMPSFRECSDATKVAVFYDLLVRLLRNRPDRRSAVAASSEFAGLPPAERARLLRLTSIETMLHDEDQSHVGRWLRRARTYNPSDARTALLAAVHTVSPALCRALVRTLAPFRPGAPETAPFADLARPAAGTAFER